MSITKIAQENWYIIDKDEMDGATIGMDNNDGTKCPLATATWNGEDDCDVEDDEIRASFMAAAPDLYRALTDLASEYQNLSGWYAQSQNMPYTETQPLSNAKAALSKARGNEKERSGE